MNRRRTAASRRKKPTRKKAARSKSGSEDRARKRPVRKNAVAKRATPKKAVRKPAKKTAPTKKATRKRSTPDRANRRRPVPKKPPPPKSRKSAAERVRAAKAAVGGWVLQRQELVQRAGRLALIGVGIVSIWWAGQQAQRYAHGSNAFAIREIVIEGNDQLEDMDVRRAARLQIGSNAFELSTEDARNHLLQHPWIEEATVVRRLPNRVRIEIVERVPVALVALDQLYLVSEDGAVFKRVGVDDPVDLPVITGIASEQFYDDFEYRTAILLRSMALLQDYEGAGLAEREPVSEIHFDGAHGIELFVGDDGMNVRLGTGQHRQKLRRLRRVLERLAREKTRPSYVYLDNVRSPERVTVRLP